MPTLVSDITVQIGTRSSDASPLPVGISDSTPYVSWSLPSNIDQQRFRVRIECVDAGNYAKSNTGIRPSADGQFQYTADLALTSSFAGLCRAAVEIGQAVGSAVMEFISPWLYFVYDPRLLQLPTGEDPTLQWDADPAHPAGGPAVTYELQISDDPQFTSTLYDNNAISKAAGAAASFTVPASGFSPASDTNYFYRVRAANGSGGWGLWSRVRAFVLPGSSPPQFTIDDVVYANNVEGDVRITFTLRDDGNGPYSVAWSFLGGSFTVDQEPMFLLDPSAIVPAGTYTITWRTRGGSDDIPQLDGSAASVQIFARATDTNGSTTDLEYGPFLVGSVGDLSGGGTPAVFDVALPLPWMEITPPIQDYDLLEPVQVAFATFDNTLSEILPVSPGKYCWQGSYSYGTLEERRSRSLTGGFGHGLMSNLPRLAYPNLLNSFGSTYDNDWTLPYATRLATHIDVTTTPSAFLFTAPRDDSFPATIPDPHGSRETAKMERFLQGYADLDGTPRDYPNGYDWTARPAWHRGREIWGQDDAWIQVAVWKFSSYDVCNTCHGRGWVASSSGPPYDRLACPNTNCQFGFDLTLPLTRTGNDSRLIGMIKPYLDVEWHRLTTWVNGRPYTARERFGVPPTLAPFATRRLHIVGNQVSNLEAVPDDRGNTLYYRLQDFPTPGQTRYLPPTIPMFWDYSADVTLAGNPSRQVNGEAALPIYERDSRGVANINLDETLPVAAGLTIPEILKQDDPVAMAIGKGTKKFFLGQVNPDSSPIAWNRPRPTQPGSLAMTTKFQRVFVTRNLAFRFLSLQGNWDSFVTVHVLYTGSADTKLRLQYRPTTSNLESDWKDLPATNGAFDADAGAWLVPPLTFYAYWDTSDPVEFPEGAQFNLRAQTFSTSSLTFSPFVLSSTVTVLHHSSNPVNVISSAYEPWSHTVKIGFRCDDTQHDAYTIVRMFYSTQDPTNSNDNAWLPISLGDVTGEMTFLSSDPTSGQNLHEIVWEAGRYGVGAGDGFRVRIECVPTNTLELITLPFFKWLGPINPHIDAAEATLADVLGTVQTQHFDQATQAWVTDDPPTYLPGEIRINQMEQERIRRNPGTNASDGFYTFWTQQPDGSWVDSNPNGYQTWLDEKYSLNETNGQALARVTQQINYLSTVAVPNAQKAMLDGEKAIRKHLIDQGYYAEMYFKGGGVGGFREVVDAVPVSNRTGAQLPAHVERWWRFRVQAKADGGDNIYDAAGLYDPQEITTLEQVFYEVELDHRSTFDSQPHGKPLRRFDYGHTGERLSIATFFGGAATTQPTDPRNQPVIDPNTGQPIPNQPGSSSFSTPQQTQTAVGGALKIKPELLPGQVAGDALDTGQTTFDGNYYWRFAAYNYFVAPIMARPRALITSTVNGSDQIVVNYAAKAHEDITTIALHYLGVIESGGITVDGYQVSDTTTVPAWVDRTFVDFTSDRRAASSDPTRKANPAPWVPSGTNRVHPCVAYDEALQQYLIFTSKLDDAGQLRIISARAMQLAVACEWDVLFADDPALAMYGPSLVFDANGRRRLFFTVQPTGLPSYLAYSLSTDADQWDAPIPVDGVPGGAVNCSVVLSGSTYHMWYQKLSSGTQSIFYATSADGASFVVQNGGNAVYADVNDVVKPSVVRLNGVWVMYLTDPAADTVFSVWSSDGITWQGRRTELVATTVPIVDAIGNTVNYAVTPQNAYAFFDAYQGNVELFLAWNYVKGDGTNFTFFGRLEDRVWRDGVNGGIDGEANNLVDVPCSRDGVPRTLTVAASPNGLDLTAPAGTIKIRLNFSNFSPTQKEYHRRSDWVDVSNVADVGGYVNPDPWYFDLQLLSYPYLRATDA
jgi:hypothetical protein